MKILVTGATGMVGAAIVHRLVQQHEVHALVRSENRARAILPAECRLVPGDVTDPSSLEGAVNGCELVFHAAGLPEQWLKDVSIFEKVNVQGTRNILEASRNAGVRRVVYTSTIDVFQADPHQSYDESVIDPAPKGTYYERSKQKADRLAVSYLENGMDIVFLHPAGVYGPGPSTSPGINDFVADLIRGKIPMLLPGGFPVVFADDCAQGHIMAAMKAKAGDRFILSDAYYSLVELAGIVHRLHPIKRIPPVMPLWFARAFAVAGEAVSSITGRPPLLPRGQLTFLLWQARPNSDHARDVLGWTSVGIEEGLSRTIADLKEKGLL